MNISIQPWCICPVMHLYTKFGGNIFIQSENIDIFRNSIWRPPPSGIFTLSEFSTFSHDGCLFLERCTKFGSNMSHNRWERPTFVPDVRLMTSCELTSGSVFDHLGVIVFDLCTKLCANTFIQYRDISMLRNSRRLPIRFVWPHQSHVTKVSQWVN